MTLNFKSPSIVSLDNEKFECKTQLPKHYQPSLKKSMKQTIEYFKNLKLIRFVVPGSSTLDQALKTYYNEYLKLYQQNKRLNRQFVQIIEVKNDLARQFLQMKKIDEGSNDNIKRHRRYACQIQRNFICPIQQCQKKYGTQGSLTQHMKLKHEEFFKTVEYEQYLSKILRNMKKQEILSV